MSRRENISYLVPRDPSIKCWGDRVKLSSPCGKNLIELGADEFEETMGGNIKVYLRLKACLSPDSPYTVISPTTLQTEAPKESVSYKNVSNGVGKLVHKFTFTSILDQETTQEKLFKKCAVKSLKKFLSGENFLLMAYGTTSAGKTYTMQGTVQHPGVIPRALDFVFSGLKDSIIPSCSYSPYQCNEIVKLSDEQVRKDLSHKNFILSLDLTRYQRYMDVTHMTLHTNSSSGYSDSYENVTFKEMQSNLVETESFEVDTSLDKYSIWISMIEIYNEQVYDLLELPNEKGVRAKLTFRDDEFGNLFVRNLRYVHVSSAHEAFQIFQFGRSNLHLAPTALNNRSSRSHCIFTITLAKFPDSDVSSHTISRFSFCDLAGMERAKKTLNLKDRLVESKAINTSLSILVKCLTTFKENQNSKEKKMIPYRESKLTKLFRDAVLGKEQFSLIINVTTEPNLFDETLSVLKFSAIAQKIVPQNVFPKPKIPVVVKRSRFSRIVVGSNQTNKPIIDWDMSTVVEDKVKDSNSESGIEESLDLVKALREELAREKKRCEEIEAEIREELTEKFSEILKKQNENHRIRMENETERLKERYEKKEKRLVYYYEMLTKNKRPKLDEDVSFAEESELRELEEGAERLRTENETLKEQLQELLAEKKRLVSECSELRFKVADKDRTLEDTKRAYEAKEAGADAHEKELREQLDKANAKITDFKSLLDEAASDYKELEENNKYLRNENEILEQQLTEHREAVADLKNETAELQKILCQKRIMIEKLEAANEVAEKQKEEAGKEKREEMENVNLREVEILREQLKKTSEWLGQSRDECSELREEKLSLEEDLEIKKLKIADLQSKLLTWEEEREEVERRMEELREKTEEVKEMESKLEGAEREKEVLERRCRELEGEVEALQKEVKDLISVSQIESERSLELERLTKENESLEEELLCLRKRNEELEEELTRQEEILDTAQRESKMALERLHVKLETVESEKVEAERQAHEVPRLQKEIRRFEKELENREKDLASFNHNRNAIFDNYEEELAKLKEENESLRKNVLAKTASPLSTENTDEKEPPGENAEEMWNLNAERECVEEEPDLFKKPELGDSRVPSDESNREESPVAGLRKVKEDVEDTPERLSRQIENLTIQCTGQKSTRKKVDLLDASIHPSTIKNTGRGRKKRENGKKEKEKEKEATVKSVENEKENLPSKRKGKCYKKLFTDNDFDSIVDLRASPLEEISRLRPRK